MPACVRKENGQIIIACQPLRFAPTSRLDFCRQGPVMSHLVRRLFIALLIIAALAASFWWFSRPKPIAVVASEIDRGTVEASIANTRAGP